MVKVPPEIIEYLSTIPEGRKRKLVDLMDLIKKLYPDAQASMRYKMPTYEIEGDAKTRWIAVANKKQYVSLYTCAAHHLVAFKKLHPKIKTGTGCINFKEKDALPLEDIAQVIHSALGTSG